MYNLRDEIYDKYFLNVLNIEDPDKDSDGKGTLQRFVETLAQDWDETVINVLFTLLDSTLIPKTVKNKFIPYLEKQLGVKPIHSSLVIRRRVLQRLIEIYKNKGNLRSYQLIFNALGFDNVEILQAGIDFGFDSSITLDHEVRTFDLGRCHKCKYYKLKLIGNVTIDSAMFAAINNALDIVQPIYAKLYGIVLNEVDVDLITIFVHSNGDLIYTTLSESNVGFTLNPNGDLIVYGDEADRYSIDENGNLIYDNEQ